ncbi:hypothetical protein [Endozoicomonas sp. SCSIO W0465]|uniref:hypothetical protein n=1 Tax=Endozoicomonas sp. SCSIO W0465 TaxID=2918516 RepID=UPI00207598DC|nr:hypothetical protein [Endozoicomonas sp. SCSIO W0465]USE38242.1 hypothetical protein MJO57_08795 [Endozoicomonas sp. SCSIO W0465]
MEPVSRDQVNPYGVVATANKSSEKIEKNDNRGIWRSNPGGNRLVCEKSSSTANDPNRAGLSGDASESGDRWTEVNKHTDRAGLLTSQPGTSGGQSGLEGKRVVACDPPNHLARRPQSEWIQYSEDVEKGEKIWNQCFEEQVARIPELINSGSDMATIFEDTVRFRKKIEDQRNPHDNGNFRFGYNRSAGPIEIQTEIWGRKWKRKIWPIAFTGVSDQTAYAYKQDQVVSLCRDRQCHKHNQKDLAQITTMCKDVFGDHHHETIVEHSSFRLVKGKNNDGQMIPLTLFVCADLSSEATHRFEIDGIFPKSKKKPNGTLMIHTDFKKLPVWMEHCMQLGTKIIAGELNLIPHLHWALVHSSVTGRGSGGIAEMLVHGLCRYHGISLPGWKEGVAPSLEALCEPEVEAFAEHYLDLFESVTPEMQEKLGSASSGGRK